MRRIGGYKTKWKLAIAYHGPVCVYCDEEPATSLDHVVPYSWDKDDSIENLVPACGLCNSIAGSKLFEDIKHKRQYIVNRRKSYGNRRAICTECKLPYAYRLHSPSLFLCAECYDREYDTQWRERSCWTLWLSELEAAHIWPEAYRLTRERLGPYRVKFRERFLELLVEFSEEIIERRELGKGSRT